MQEMIEIIKKQIEKEINDNYTEYKNKKLNDLNEDLERMRNSIVQDVLNSVKIMTSREPSGVHIMIKVENRIIMSEQERR